VQWSQVDRREKVVRLEVGTTKNRKARTLPYGGLAELAVVIEAQWQDHRRLASEGTLCPYLFQRNGKPIRDLRKAWSTACKIAGVPGKRPHDFRRSAVRNLIRAGVPDSIVMGITGHKTRAVFDRYDITTEADLRDGLGKLSDATGTKKGQSGRSGRVSSFPLSP
jgi:integrase